MTELRTPVGIVRTSRERNRVQTGTAFHTSMAAERPILELNIVCVYAVQGTTRTRLS
jgi:hypothetical protein